MGPRITDVARTLLVGALLWLAPLQAATVSEREELARVDRAYDGDSLRLADGREVRLIGINTPELGKEGAPDEPLAVAARDRADALTRGRVVKLSYDVERLDRHGRTLAYVFLPDGRDLQEILASEGFAWFIAISPNVAHLARYRAAEGQARAAHRGIWARPEYRPTPVAELDLKSTGFRRIVGTVHGLAYRRDYALLALDSRVRLLISRDDFRRPQSLIGKRVLARGWLTEYKNGLRMRITHPAMLEQLP